MCLVMIPAGAWILAKVRPGLAVLATETDEHPVEVPDEVEAPDEVPDEDTDAADGTPGAEETTVDATPDNDGERLET
jgi:hypothetical protein